MNLVYFLGAYWSVHIVFWSALFLGYPMGSSRGPHGVPVAWTPWGHLGLIEIAPFIELFGNILLTLDFYLIVAFLHPMSIETNRVFIFLLAASQNMWFIKHHISSPVISTIRNHILYRKKTIDTWFFYFSDTYKTLF